MQTSTKLGPLARSDLRNNVQRQVDDAVKQGGKILVGGKPMTGPGYFYEPTVLTGLAHSKPIVAEEFFGPVAMLFPVRDGVELANAGGAATSIGPTGWRRTSKPAPCSSMTLCAPTLARRSAA
jgi:acyl-CoA reductase-like NAD-dependent aldehyde dehydrogenase